MFGSHLVFKNELPNPSIWKSSFRGLNNESPIDHFLHWVELGDPWANFSCAGEGWEAAHRARVYVLAVSLAAPRPSPWVFALTYGQVRERVWGWVSVFSNWACVRKWGILEKGGQASKVLENKTRWVRCDATTTSLLFGVGHLRTHTLARSLSLSLALSRSLSTSFHFSPPLPSSWSLLRFLQSFLRSRTRCLVVCGLGGWSVGRSVGR